MQPASATTQRSVCGCEYTAQRHATHVVCLLALHHIRQHIFPLTLQAARYGPSRKCLRARSARHRNLILGAPGITIHTCLDWMQKRCAMLMRLAMGCNGPLVHGSPNTVWSTSSAVVKLVQCQAKVRKYLSSLLFVRHCTFRVQFNINPWPCSMS